jgi:hypothetical protein
MYITSVKGVECACVEWAFVLSMGYGAPKQAQEFL